MSAPPFAMLLAIWGDRYGAAHLNEITSQAFALSPGLGQVVLLTDRPREGLDPRIRQLAFPPPFNGPEFFTRGYRAKLAVFLPEITPPGLPCVYLDLDSVVIGDVGRIAALAPTPDRIFMLPPAGLGFSRARRIIDRLRANRSHPVGNSSVMAFHAGVTCNPALLYAKLLEESGTALPGGTPIDDRLISWLARDIIHAMPTDCAVMLRREFLSHLPFWPEIKAGLPWISARRARIAVVTMNGPKVKADTLGRLPEGSRIQDGRGRNGRWSPAGIGALWPALSLACQRLAAAINKNDTESR